MQEVLYKCAKCEGVDEDCDFAMAFECFEEVGEVYCDSCYEAWLERDPAEDECGHDKWLANNGF